MKLPLQLTFRDIGHSRTIEEQVDKRAAKLDTFCGDIMRCRVMVEVPHRHHHRGNRYHVRIDMTVPGDELVVANDTQKIVHEDLRACVDDAFDGAERVLEDYVRRRRADVKHHEPSERGRVRRIFPQDGYGFIETRDGSQVYFHRDSVLDQAFDRLEVGTEVRFVSEQGEKGPQASTVEWTRSH